MIRSRHLSLALPKAFPRERGRLLSGGNAEGTKLGGRIYAPLCQCTTLMDGYPNGPLAAERSRDTKSPDWRANDELGHVKQSQYFLIFFVQQIPVCHLLSSLAICTTLSLSCKWPIFKLKFYSQFPI